MKTTIITSDILCGPELYKEMKSSFDYSQITWTINRYNKSISDSHAAALLDAFLQFNESAILKDIGRVTHEIALALAEKEFDKYSIIQDKLLESDFDKAVKKTKSEKRKTKSDE